MRPQDSGDVQRGSTWVQGALAGLIATLPMTIFMLSTQRFLPHGERYDLPPEIITKELAERAHIRHHMNKLQILGATLVSHFGYGAAMGTLSTLVGRLLPLPPLLRGGVLGLLVWAGSYLGLLPLLGMSETGVREPGRRNLMMIGAHVIWGTAMEVTANALMPGRSSE